MPQQAKSPSLYGISEDNSSRHGSDLWGKNQFNSTFPLSLCLYMRDNEINPVSVIMDEGATKASDDHWAMSDIVGGQHDDCHYIFEEAYSHYAGFSRNQADRIDLVVVKGGEHAIPLEIKLTVVPDSGTAKMEEIEWAPEIVIRPVSSAHAMMGVAHSLVQFGNEEAKDNVISALRPAYNQISSWENNSEINQNSNKLCSALQKALMFCEEIQSPFLMQPIWRTKGQSPELCEQCFDVFVWSDLSIMAIPVQEHNRASGDSLLRTTREIARHVRSLYDILQTGDHNYSGIYKGMSLDTQTDKSFSLPGRRSIKYLRHPRLTNPALHQDCLLEIILHGGEKALKPERRFDSAVQLHFAGK